MEDSLIHFFFKYCSKNSSCFEDSVEKHIQIGSKLFCFLVSNHLFLQFQNIYSLKKIVNFKTKIRREMNFLKLSRLGWVSITILCDVYILLLLRSDIQKERKSREKERENKYFLGNYIVIVCFTVVNYCSFMFISAIRLILFYKILGIFACIR